MASQVRPDRPAVLARPATAIGLLLSLFALPLLAASNVVENPLLGDALAWAIAGVVVVIVVHFESAPLSSIGVVRPRLRDVGWAAGLAVAAIGVFALTSPLIEALGLPTREGIAAPSLVVGLVGAVTAGVTEEILYRGYPIERFVEAGYRPLVAGGLTWALFSLAHVGSGYPAGNLVQIALAGLVITAVYVRTRSLFPVVLGHVVVDVVGVLAYVYS